MLKILGASVQLFFTLALDGGGWSTLLSGRFNPGKEPQYSLHRRLGRPQSLPGEVRMIENFLPLPVFETLTVRYANHFT